MAATDGELLAAYLAERSEEASSELVRRHAGMVAAACRRALGDPGAADDAAQAVFLTLFRKAPALRSEPSLAGWLLGTAELVCRNARRERAARARREEEAGMLLAGKSGTDRAGADLSAELDPAVAELPARYREVVALRFYQGRSPAEIAAALGCPPETVAKRLSRALDRLRARLSRRGGECSAAVLAGLLAGRLADAPAEALVVSIQGLALGKAAASPPALAMMEAAMKAMFWVKVKLAAAVAAGALVVGGGGTAVILAGAGEPAAVAVGSKETVIKGRVISVEGEKVGISVGSADGVRAGFEFEVARDGQKVGTVKVAAVEKDRAQGSGQGAIRVGDEVSTRLTVVATDKPATGSPGTTTGSTAGAGQPIGPAAVKFVWGKDGFPEPEYPNLVKKLFGKDEPPEARKLREEYAKLMGQAEFSKDQAGEGKRLQERARKAFEDSVRVVLGQLTAEEYGRYQEVKANLEGVRKQYYQKRSEIWPGAVSGKDKEEMARRQQRDKTLSEWFKKANEDVANGKPPPPAPEVSDKAKTSPEMF
jgi:RNA polymerase sigma factor (sigma-70 family)